MLTAHPEVDFVQLQINYADWENPGTASRECWEIARRHGKPITIMEPLKGGALADPIPSVQEIFKEADPEAPIVSWGIRYAASLEGIITVLFGMSSLEQMEQNLSFMKDFVPLTDVEQTVIQKAQAALDADKSIPCTGCHYCVDGCPMNIPIPEIIAVANRQLNDPTQSEQIVVSCSDWVGLFFSCNPCISRVTGYGGLEAMCQSPHANNSKSRSKTCK